MKFSVSIPFEKGEEKKFLKYVSRQQGKGECQYLKDKKEESNNPIKLRIAEVAAIEGKYNLGVYARQYIKKGDVIGYYKGKNVKSGEVFDRKFLMIMNKNQQLDATCIFNWTRFLNHSSFSCNCYFAESNDGRAIQVLKNIKEGEQLLVDYGGSYVFDINIVYLHPTDNDLSYEEKVAANKGYELLKITKDTVPLSSMKKIFDFDDCDEIYLTKLHKQVLFPKLQTEFNKGEVNEEEVDLPCYFLKNKKYSSIQQQVTPLMFACYKGLIKEVKYLLKHNADPLRNTLHGGHNSLIFTILGTAENNTKKEIFKLLTEKVFSSRPRGYKYLIDEETDSQGLSIFDYICKSDLLTIITDPQDKNSANKILLNLQTKILNGNFPNKFSKNVVKQIDLKKLSFELPCVNFYDKNFNSKNKRIKKEENNRKATLTASEIKREHYKYVKAEVDVIQAEEIEGLLKKCECKLNHNEIIEMYKQVFAHCACYLDAVDSLKYKNKVDNLLNFFQNKISWKEKLLIFSYALQDLSYWHGRDYDGKPWNSIQAFKYLKDKLDTGEYCAIRDKMSVEKKEEFDSMIGHFTDVNIDPAIIKKLYK